MSLRKIFLSCILLSIIFNKIMATRLYAHLKEDLPEIVTCKRLQNIYQEPRTHVGIFCQSYMIQLCGDRMFDDLDIELYFRQKFCFVDQIVNTSSSFALLVIDKSRQEIDGFFQDFFGIRG